MATTSVTVWFDPEADFLEVIFDPTRAGYFRETPDDRVMEKVSEDGTVLGFSIMGVSDMRSGSPIHVELPAARS